MCEKSKLLVTVRIFGMSVLMVRALVLDIDLGGWSITTKFEFQMTKCRTRV